VGVPTTVRSLLVVSTFGLLTVPTATAAAPPVGPVAGADASIHAGAPWARHPGDDLDRSLHEQRYGVDLADLPPVEPFWQGNLLFSADGFGRTMLARQGLPPLPASNYPAAPGILYVAMTGVTLRPNCGNGDNANAALNCSPLVDQETVFPAFGSGAQQTTVFQELQGYYEPFNLVMTNERPPDWVPYTMAVVGGTASQAGQGGGTCGVANVACDGLKRNHVSLTFPESCGGVAEIAAQETSHNWGLEHVDNQTDLLYPFNNGGFKTFVDGCHDINHATSETEITQCDYIHEEYCPAGAGEQQNSYAELLGVFGPRQVDDIAPVIASMSPENGATLTSDDNVSVTARVEENSNFLAAKWTWIDGLPEDLESYTRCTNNTCDLDYNVGVGFDPNEIAWDFVALEQPPPGEYTFKFEVVDAYGNYDSQTVTFTVEGAAGSDSGGDSGDGGTGGGSGDDGGTGDEGGTSGASQGQDDEGGTDDGGATDTDPGAGDGGGQGCACRAIPDARSDAWLWLLGLVFIRRARRGR
jgi:hypothetical protein